MDRRIDVGFVPLPIVEMNPALRFELVQEVETMITLPPGHRPARNRRVTLRQLVDERFVFFERATGLRYHARIGYGRAPEFCCTNGL
jgi:DNA-binding transcriptional LysR family regulator